MDNNYNLDFSKVFDSLFLDRELSILNYFATRDVDLEKLKESGDIEEIIEERDGVTTRTITYTSFDGQQTFQRTYTYNKASVYAEKIRKINEKINECIKNEEFEKAALLKKEKVRLLEQSDK